MAHYRRGTNLGGQNLAVCEAQINEWGLKAFDEEAQHNVIGGDGYMFNVSRLESIAVDDVPKFVAVALAFDLAATEGGGNHTVGVLMGKAANGTYYVLAVLRGQWSPDRVRACITLASAYYKAQYFSLQVHLPQDPGQSGKDQALQMAQRFLAYNPNIETVSGSKTTRAAGLAEDVNKGNVYLVEQDLPDFLADKYLAQTGYKPLLDDLSWQNWHRRFKGELKSFRADVKDQADDQVDAASDSHTELNTAPETPIVTPGYGVGTGWEELLKIIYLVPLLGEIQLTAFTDKTQAEAANSHAQRHIPYPTGEKVIPVRVFERLSDYLEQQQEEVIRANALAKLTDEEKRVLGLTE